MRAPSDSENVMTREVFKSPVRLVISLIIVILVIDVGVTMLLRAFPIYYNNLKGLVDAVVLVVLIGPVLYFLVFKPMLHFIVRNVRLQKEDQVLYEITQGVTSALNLEELLKLIHTSISKVLYAENCFFALYDQEKSKFSFSYFVDKYDDAPEGWVSLEKSCTAYVLKKGESMLMPGDLFMKLSEKGEVELIGSFSPSWMGIPLKTSSKTIGILVLQHYEKENVYDEGHLRFLDSIASQVANVIERKRAEENLEKSFSLLSATLESTADGIVVVDKNRKITDFNRKFAELWHIPESVLKNRNGEELKAYMIRQMKEPDVVRKVNDEIYKDEEKTSFDIMECKDGRIFERYSQPQRMEGKVLGRVWSYRDITERRKSERELQASEERFRTVFENSPIGIEIYNGDGIQLDINKTALDIFGIAKKKDSLGFNLFSGTSLNTDLKNKLLRGDRISYTSSFDFEKVKKLGQYKTSKQGKSELHYSITPLKSNDKTVVGYLMLIQDITERLNAERELKEQEIRYRTLFESANDAIFIMGRSIFINCNRMTLQIFECENKDDFIGHSPWELSPEYQPSGYTSEKLAQEKIEDAFNGTPQRFYWKHRTLKGNLFDAEVVLNRVEMDGAYYLQAVVRDITERKKADDLLKENEIRLRELNASKDRFFSIIAHDLKSPFNAILGFSDLLTEKIREKDYDDIEDLSGLIQTSAERTMNLLTGLLDWARSQTGRVKFEPKTISVRDIVDETIDSLKDVSDHKSIGIDVDIKEVEEVYADEVMMGTVLRNLVSNAIKFTHMGGKVAIAARQDNGMTLFKVKDTGIGIEKENLKKLFSIDEGYSNPGTLNEQGTGLGLLICKEFVEKHGGHIWAESEKGNGSTFWFTFPRKNGVN